MSITEREKAVTFASVLANAIYANRDVLYAIQPPGGFAHRVEQKNALVLELAPILLNSAVTGVFVYGNPGTGKTALVQDLLQELQQEAAKRVVKLQSVYVNCSENRTETAILLEVLNQLKPEQKYPRMGWNRAKAVDEFQRIVQAHVGQVLVVLDEIDYVLKESGDDILYRLTRIKGKRLSTITISNDVRVSDYLKPRTQSVFGRVKIIFSPYSSEELFDIMRDRVKLAFKSGVVSDAVLRKIAELEAQKNGDARQALELLDSCGKIALSEKRDRITLDLVEHAEAQLEKDHLLNIIVSLPRHQKLVYLSILKNQKEVLAGGDIYKLYVEICESYNQKPLSERRIRSFLINLTELGLLESEVGWLSDTQRKARKVEIPIDAAVRQKAIKMLRDSI